MSCNRRRNPLVDALLFLLAPVVLATAALAQIVPDLLVVVTEGKHGFISTSGELVIPATFDFAWNFSEGLASVTTDGKWGYINGAGVFVIPPQFQYARAFVNGL